MVVAISIPDALREDAEEFARQRGITLDQVCEEAIVRLVRNTVDLELIDRINAVCAQGPTADPVLQAMQFRSLDRDEW